MDNTITTARPDVVTVQTTARPTAPPPHLPFAEVLSSSAIALVQGAQAAVHALPGAPVLAAAVRGGGLGVATAQSPVTSPEGPTTTSLGTAMAPLSGGVGMPGALASVGGAGGTAGGGDGGVESSLAQSQQLNLYYLQIQEQVNDQNRTFTLLSNVIEVEHSTAKSAIGNIH
jgi:hypothetical protein